MAVIDTSMDMPKSCFTCEYNKEGRYEYYCTKTGLSVPNGAKNCPLKSLDDYKPVIHGRWVRITQGAIIEKYMCSVCHRQIEHCGAEAFLTQYYPYCHCGAQMDGKDQTDGTENNI